MKRTGIRRLNADWIPAAADRYTPGRFEPVDRIVLHTTTVTMEQTIATFQAGSRLVSANYIVGRDARIVQMVSESDTAWHAGDWPMNKRSIGIEHVDDGDYDGVRPEALYVATIGLCHDICQRHGLPADRVTFVDHSQIVATHCPGTLDTNRIVAGAGAATDNPVMGASKITLGRLAAYIAANCPAAPAGLSGAIWNASLEFEVRAEVMLAQQIKETNIYHYGSADPVFAADASFNNFAGIKTTDSSATARFATVELGCVAQAAHLRWYAAPTHRGARCAQPFDPRHFGAHKNNVVQVGDLGGKWAPASTYGSSMVPRINDILAFGGDMAGFDPRNNPTDLAFMDARFRELMLGEPALTATALRRALQGAGFMTPEPKKASKHTAADVRKGHGRGRGK